MFQTYHEAQAAFREDAAMLAAHGIVLDGVTSYTPEPWKRDDALAMDAQPALSSFASGSIPAFLLTSIDPAVTRVLFAATKAAEIFGERKAGTWTDRVRLFQYIENTGEVSSYGDYNSNGSSDVNVNWPQRQNYVYQTMEQFGDMEIDLAGVAKINLVSEKGISSANALKKFENLSYFYGIAGLQNYGLLNDPNLIASIGPGAKAYSGSSKTWFFGGSVQATANEIYLDIQNLFAQAVTQSSGLIEAEDEMVLAMSPLSAVALKTTNSFNVNVYDLLKKNFPKIRFETAVQYGTQTAANPNGNPAGNLMQMIFPKLEGQQTGFMAFSEKMRTHPIVRDVSSYRRKKTSGTWGAIILQPIAIATMLGI